MNGLAEAPLLERESELTSIGDLLDQAAGGEGRVCVIQGPPGIGKTRLATAARQQARDRAMRTFAARGGSLEIEFPFGIVRQLFEGELRAVSQRERDRLLAGAPELLGPALGLGVGAVGQPPPDGLFALLNGLYWLTSNLIEQTPALIVVDDAHWADMLSLRFVDYLARRVADLPLLVLIASRSSESGPQLEIIGPLSADSATALITPRALTASATATAVRALLVDDAADEFCEACHAASAGNPFMLRGLIGAIRQDGIQPTAEEAAHVARIAPGTIARSVLARLRRHGADANDLARAIAVLGSHATLEMAAALAELDDQGALKARDALTTAELVSHSGPVEFVHPVVREAIYAELSPADRTRLHFRAARMLRDQDSASDLIAVHLLATEPSGEEWVVTALRHAAADALAQGAPSVAATYLRRALAEPPGESARASVTGELGRAELLAGDPTAIDHLEIALDRSPADGQVEGTIMLANALAQFGRFGEAIERIDRMLAQLPPGSDGAILALEAAAITVCRMLAPTYPDATRRIERVAGLIHGDSVAESGLRSNLSFYKFLEGGSSTDAVADARQALESGQLQVFAPSFYDALYTVIVADEWELAELYCSQALTEARGSGSTLALTMLLAFHADLAYRRGNLIEAESDARAALSAAQQEQLSITPIPLAHLIGALVERGEADTAAELFGELLTAPIPDTLPHNYLLFSRARLQLLIGRVDAALSDLGELADRERHWRVPRMFPHRSTAAPLMASGGQLDAARRTANEELELARRWGAARAIGIALRALGLVEGGEYGRGLLVESASLLADSGAPLEHARTLVELGAALRRDGYRKQAREPLRQGLELAYRSGATVLQRRAVQELRAAGARPNAPLRTGRGALTPSERRIAELAAGGAANREIAQTLFLSLKTVEMHLAHAYQKLDIRSRTELPSALKAA